MFNCVFSCSLLVLLERDMFRGTKSCCVSCKRRMCSKEYVESIVKFLLMFLYFSGISIGGKEVRTCVAGDNPGVGLSRVNLNAVTYVVCCPIIII